MIQESRTRTADSSTPQLLSSEAATTPIDSADSIRLFHHYDVVQTSVTGIVL